MSEYIRSLQNKVGSLILSVFWLGFALVFCFVTGCGGGGGENNGPVPTTTSVAQPKIGTVLYANGFSKDTVGVYTSAALNAGWNNPSWSNGIKESRVFIADDADTQRGRSMEVRYPLGAVGPTTGGAQWQLRLGKSYDELYCSYRVKFPQGFNFVKGGKLPGFAGGAANTGGTKPDGTDGWSGRLMWGPGGKVYQYVYHPDQPTNYGDEFYWNENGQQFFQPGTWHNIEVRIVMNTPGKKDGIIQGWYDGVLALNISNLRFRDVSSFGIDMLYFSTFFGGDDTSWAPTKDESVYFDDFKIAVILH